MNATAHPQQLRLPDVVEHQHEEVLAALGQQPLDAVAWCSAHLAAAEHVLHDAAARLGPGGREHVADATAADHALEEAVCHLDRVLTGDGHSAETPATRLAEELVQQLAAHAAAERRLVADLEQVLDADEEHALAVRLVEAVAHAPTRPHPHASRTHLGRRLGYPLESWVDQVRDVMDNRSAHGPHAVSTPRPPGRWGYYFAGVPFPSPDEQGSDPAEVTRE